MGKLFGTDGVRGRANTGLITPQNAMQLAIAVSNYLESIDHKSVNSKFSVVIGKDTRLSGYMLESALASGFIAAGANVFFLGPIPTPAVASLTKALRADLGVVVSASHNPYQDNGIKFFNSNGFKLNGESEGKITELFFSNNLKLAEPNAMGKAKRLEDGAGRYIEFVKSSFPRDLSLMGIKVVLDTANGAAYKVAPQVFWELGATVVTVGNEPDGLNINEGCGATDLSLLQKSVVENGADIGFAFDGDADRVIVVDSDGEIVDGDFIISAIATSWKKLGKLTSNKVVTTTMSNLGLEKYLKSIGLELERSDVGDKYVVEKMIKIGANLGGEKSGHIIPLNYASTGDGIIAALQVLAYLIKSGEASTSIKALFEPVPQIMKNIRRSVDLSCPNILNGIQQIERDLLKQSGRILVRKSGTEDIIRIMVESEDEATSRRALEDAESLVIGF